MPNSLYEMGIKGITVNFCDSVWEKIENWSLRKTTVASAVLGVSMRFIKEMVPQFRIPWLNFFSAIFCTLHL